MFRARDAQVEFFVVELTARHCRHHVTPHDRMCCPCLNVMEKVATEALRFAENEQ